MRILILLVVMLAPASMVHAAVSRQRHPYVKHWKKSTYGKGAVARVGVGAGVAQMRHRPRNYGGGAAGFGKRLGAGATTHAVKTTVEHGIAAKLHEDLHYHRSSKKGVGPRLGHALKSTVVTQNTKTGKGTPAAGRVAGHAAAGAVSQGVLAGASGASTAGVGLAADAGANVAREFWPRRHRRVHTSRVAHLK
jgi:hypothetical protein